MKIDFDGLIRALESQAQWDFDEYYFDRNKGEVLSADGLGRDDQAKLKNVETDSGRFVLIKPLEPHDVGALMDDFTARIKDAEIKETLESVFMTGSWRTPFLGFKEIVSEYPEVQEQWDKFHKAYMEEIACEWLRKNGISADRS